MLKQKIPEWAVYSDATGWTRPVRSIRSCSEMGDVRASRSYSREAWRSWLCSSPDLVGAGSSLTFASRLRPAQRPR